MTPTVLVVEHDPAIGAPLVEQLVADGYPTRLARTAGHARALARASPPGLVILGELEAPRAALELLIEIRTGRHAQGSGSEGRGQQGWDSAVRGEQSRVGEGRSQQGEDPQDHWSTDLPAIVVGAGTQESDLLRAFEAGADDFLVRPASYLELRARLRALLTRTERTDCTDSQSLVRVGSLTIDVRARAVSLHGHPVPLRRLEYELLLTLARDPERVFARHELLRLVWGYRAPGCTRTLDSHVSRLRQRLGSVGAERWIVNVRGVGYRLV